MPTASTPTMPTDASPSETYFTHDWNDDDSLTNEIVSAVAELTGKNELDVERVYDRLDPDSLNSLFAETAAGRTAEDGLLVFTLEGCTVTVHGSGVVIVTR